MLNTAIDFYFTKEYKVRPFIGLGGHNSFLLNNNLNDTGLGNEIELNNSVYGIFMRYGARQKFSKFEIAVIVETYHNLNGLGTHNSNEIKGHTGSVMFYLGIPLSQ